MRELTDFNEDIAVVTGGTRGIGRAVAEQLAQAGARTIATYHADEAAATETREQLAEYAAPTAVKRCDVRDFDAVDTMFEDITSDFGEPTVVVNNAGVRRDSLLVRMGPDEWQDVIATNLTGTFNCTRHATRRMLRGDGGRVVNVTSIAGQHGWQGQANYAASKAGIFGFTRAVARELGGKGIRVNAVAPGYTDTELLEDLAVERREAERDATPQNRFADPTEIAAAIIFLASPAASFVNGEILRADGGRLA
ncbi:MAG: 3-oxoacyl-ACP reductase FabG [Haloarcula sp.]